MNKRETAMIVARVADIDRRTLSDTIVESWHEIVGHLEYPVALEALKIVATESVDTIKPGHLLRAAPAARAQIQRATARAARQRMLDAAGRRDRQAIVAAEIRAMEKGYPV